MSNSSDFSLSIIVPIYNASKYVNSALSSLFSYEKTDFELICVDDGSTDDSLKLLNDFAINKVSSTDKNRLKIIHTENAGPGAARNVGIKNACGEYITFFDVDDEIELSAIYEMVQMLKTKNADVAISNYLEVFDSGKINEYKYRFKVAGINCLFQKIAVYAKVYSLKFIKENAVEFPNLYQGEDRVFLGRIANGHPKMVYLEKPSYRYLRHDTSLEKSLTHKFTVESLCQRLDSWKLFYDTSFIQFPDGVNLSLAGGMRFIWQYFSQMEENDKEVAFQKIYDFFCYIKQPKIDDRIFEISYADFISCTCYKDFCEKRVNSLSGLPPVIHDDFNIPEITIIIPMYNLEKYIAECLSSIQKQTFENYEIICVDDGSSDKTCEIVTEFMTLDKRIRLLKQNHKMAGVARNYGMTISRGKFYLFLDGDDFFEPTMLQEAHAQIEKDNADVCLFDARLYFENYKKYLDVNYYLRKNYLPETIPFEGKSYKYVLNLSPASPWNKLIRRSLIEEYGYKWMDLPRCNDIYFIFMSMALAHKITVVSKTFVNYRQVSTSLQANNDKSPLNWYFALKQFKESLVELGYFNQVEQSFINYVLSIGLYNLFSLRQGENFISLFNKMKNEIFVEFNVFEKPNVYFYEHNQKNLSIMRAMYSVPNSKFLEDYFNALSSGKKFSIKKDDSSESYLLNEFSARRKRTDSKLWMLFRKVKGTMKNFITGISRFLTLSKKVARAVKFRLFSK